MHKPAAEDISTGTTDRKLVHIGAGTLRAADRGPYRNPHFNLLCVTGRSVDTNKWGKIIVYPFHFDGTRFCAHAAFNDGLKSDMAFGLVF
jgi:hypothetical protein